MLVLLLIVGAATCLATGLIAANLVFTYVALGLAVAAAALMLGKIALPNRDASEVSASSTTEINRSHVTEEYTAADTTAAGTTTGDTGGLASEEDTSDASGTASVASADNDIPVAVASEPATDDASSPVSNIPSEAPVFVVPGRKRFHRDTCHLLRKDREELTLDEAREEGFTACTACAADLSPALNSPALNSM